MVEQETSEKVYSAIETHWLFFLPIQGADEYRHIPDLGIWRHESRIDETTEELTTVGKFKDDIAGNIVDQIFGTKADQCCVLETIGGGPEWLVVIDADKSPYTRAEIESVCQVLTDFILAGEDFRGGDTYIVNRSGNPNYYDPATYSGDFEIPEPIIKRLGQICRKPVKEATCQVP